MANLDALTLREYCLWRECDRLFCPLYQSQTLGLISMQYTTFLRTSNVSPRARSVICYEESFRDLDYRILYFEQSSQT